MLSSREQPCCQEEPELWATFCRMTNRPDSPSDIWLVSDVLVYMEARRRQNGTEQEVGKDQRNE